MGVKIPTNAISTLIIGASLLGGSLCIASPTYAYDVEASAVDPNLLPVGMEINGRRYWDASELTEASQLISTKREEFCQGDSMCEEELARQQMNTLGGIYRAIDPFENIRLLLTSVNPSQNTVKLLYHDQDKMRSSMLGETVRYDISSIYVVWVDESIIGDPSKDARWLSYDIRYPFHLGSEEETTAATHIIMDESETKLGQGWFTPNVEREYHSEDGSLVDNTTSRIYFALNATNDGGHSYGTFNYSSCTNSPDYVDGMGCKIMYADNGSRIYLPFTPAPAMQTDSELTTATPSESSDSGSIDHPSTESLTTEVANASQTSEDSSTGYGGTTTSLTSVETVGSIDLAARQNVSAPDTGSSTREECDEDNSTGFPWWAVLLPFIFAFFIFSWLFLLPLFKNSNEKNG